jgi:hypothetical protein
LNLEIFCCLGLLKFPEQLEASLNLLLESEKTEANRLLAEMKDRSKPELLARWSSVRSEEYAAVSKAVEDLSGIRLEDLPPALREWWLLWAEHQHE